MALEVYDLLCNLRIDNRILCFLFWLLLAFHAYRYFFQMKVLHLTLKKQWYDMIASGEKLEEYREIKPYWSSRLMMGFPQVYGIDFINPDFKSFVGIIFRNGYSCGARQISFKLDSISIGEGRPEWGAEPDKKYFVIKFSPLIKI